MTAVRGAVGPKGRDPGPGWGPGGVGDVGGGGKPRLGTIAREDAHTSGLYTKRPLVIVRGEGARLWDEEGREYIDCVGGQGSANLGHGNTAVADAIAQQLGIDEVHAEVLPQGKNQVVENLQPGGRKVVFVGDGINDAPALAQADVGIALASGTDIAMEAADVTLTHGQLGGVVTAIVAARRTLRTIRGNLFWAFIYNILLIPVAAGVAAPIGIHLNPMLAGVAMGMSSVFVLGNSLRLKRLQGFRSTAPADAAPAH